MIGSPFAVVLKRRILGTLKIASSRNSERRHVKDLGKSAMLLSWAWLETLQSVAENVPYQKMLAIAERVREDTRRAAQEIERIVASRRS